MNRSIAVIISILLCALPSAFARQGSVMILNQPDFPIERFDVAPSDPEILSDLFKGAGWQVELIDSTQMADAETLNATRCDVLILPYGSLFPIDAGDNFRAFVRDNGKFISMGGVTFRDMLRKEQGKWELIDLTERVKPADGWWIHSVPRSKIPDGATLRLTGWVKAKELSGIGGGFLTIYQMGPDGNVVRFFDSGMVKGDTDWQYHEVESRLHPETVRVDFKVGIWNSPGEFLADELTIAYSGDEPDIVDNIDGHLTETGSPANWEATLPAECSVSREGKEGLALSVASVGAKLKALSSFYGSPADGVFLESYMFPIFDAQYDLEHVVSGKPSEGQNLFSPAAVVKESLEGYATAGVVVDKARWKSLLDGFDAYGQPRGPLGAIMYVRPKETPGNEWQHFMLQDYHGAAWAYFGVTNRDLFDGANPAMMQGLLAVAEDLMRSVFMMEPQSRFDVYRPGESTRATITVCNSGADSFDGNLRVSITREGSAVPLEVKQEPVTLNVTEEETRNIDFSTVLEEAGYYRVDFHLYDNGLRIDEMKSSFMVLTEETETDTPVFEYKNNYYHLKGKPVFVTGTDDWYKGTWPDPLQMRHHAIRRRDSGMTLYETLNGTQGLKDWFLRRLDKMVEIQNRQQQIYMMGTLIGYNVAATDEQLKQQAGEVATLAKRYVDAPAIIHYLNGDLRCILEDEIQPLWNRYLEETYGTDEALREAWGPRAPEEPLGNIPVYNERQNGEGWNDVRVFDVNRFRGWLIRRWTGRIAEEVRKHDDSPVMCEFYAYPHEGVDVPVANTELDISNIGYFKETRRFAPMLAYSDQRALGKSFGIGEFGARYHPLFMSEPSGLTLGTPLQKARNHYLSVHMTIFGMGGSHVQTWDWWAGEFSYSPWALTHHNTLQPRPLLKWVRNVNLLMRQMTPIYKTPEVAFLTADNFRLSGSNEYLATHYAVVEGLRIALAAQPGEMLTLNEYNLKIPDSVKVIFYPLPYLPPDSVCDQLVDFVDRGGTLYISGDVSFDLAHHRTLTNRLEKICGVHFSKEVFQPFGTTTPPAETYTSLSHPNLSRQGHPAIRIKPGSAEVLWQTEAGEPVMVKNRIGKGQVFFSTDPLEFYSNKESLEQLEQNALLYRDVLRAAGLNPVDITPHAPGTQVFRLPLADGGRLYVINNIVNPEMQTEFTLREVEPAVSLDVKAEQVGVVWIDGEDRLRAIACQGKAKQGGQILLQTDFPGFFISFDEEDLSESKQLVCLPFEPGAFSMASNIPWEQPRLTIGTVEDLKWKTFEESALDEGNDVSWEMTPLQNLNILLLSEKEKMQSLQQKVVQTLTEL